MATCSQSPLFDPLALNTTKLNSNTPLDLLYTKSLKFKAHYHH